MDMYLSHLLRRLATAGGSLQQQPVSDLGQVARLAPIVVNATGMGARGLAGYDQLTPIRRQLVVVDNPGITLGSLTLAQPHSSPHLLSRHAVVIGSGLPPTISGSLQFGLRRLSNLARYRQPARSHDAIAIVR